MARTEKTNYILFAKKADLEKTAQKSMPTNFDVSEVIRLIGTIITHDKLTEANELGEASKQVRTSIYQADTVLAKIFLKERFQL